MHGLPILCRAIDLVTGQVRIECSISVVIMTQLNHNFVSLISQGQFLPLHLFLSILDALVNQGVTPVARGQILFKIEPGASQRHPVVDKKMWPLW